MLRPKWMIRRVGEASALLVQERMNSPAASAPEQRKGLRAPPEGSLEGLLSRRRRE